MLGIIHDEVRISLSLKIMVFISIVDGSVTYVYIYESFRLNNNKAR